MCLNHLLVTRQHSASYFICFCMLWVINMAQHHPCKNYFFINQSPGTYESLMKPAETCRKAMCIKHEAGISMLKS